ncbi:MAG: efflux RND transporter periplasmic adaptor subunit [Rhodocyclaceae bacterium]|nr:efflux RND transporter periplasmic adaptor subunit [Rhodocyclaceae bacterium]
MNSKTLLAVIAALAITAGVGYWSGQRSQHPVATVAPTAGQETPKKILFYRNPMGLADTSQVPKKDPMGMDYIAVFDSDKDEAPTPSNQIKISTEKVQKLGVRTELASLRSLDRIVRAAGRIEPDERRTYAISPKFEGYIERLYINTTGQSVAKGQSLFEVYSPELVSAQREYNIAAQGVRSLKDADGEARVGMQRLADSSLMRLKNWDISEEQITALGKSGETKRTMTFRSPVSGIVSEKKAVQGIRFMPGETLYQITDLSTVWVLADVFEQDIGQVKVGTSATVKINAYPGKDFKGSIAYIYPTLTAETRTVPVRLELANPGALLKPGMFAEIELAVGANTKVITVPTSAVIDSGTRRIVLIQVGEGRFEPREVKLGARTDTYVAITQGVTEGELVVVAANFLIDAESNLKAAVGGFGQATAAKPGATGAPAAVTQAAHSGH